MSSTNRGGDRAAADFYITPPYCIKRFIEGTDLPGGRWLEPCAGDGQFIRVINEMRSDIVWSAGELRETERPNLAPLTPGGLYIGDFLNLPDNYYGPEKFSVIITNPPFSLAFEVIEKCLTMADNVVMLLRLNFWGSEKRAAWLREHPADTFVLPNRPMFCLNKKGKPATDSPEYAFFRWSTLTGPHEYGLIKLLGSSSKEERREWAENLKKLGNYAAISNAESSEV